MKHTRNGLMGKMRLKPMLGLALAFCLLAAGCAEAPPKADGSKTAGAPAATDNQAKPVDKKALKKIVIAEPVHLVGYLPLYLAIKEGYFTEKGLDVSIIAAAGGAHVTSVISGDAWGVIGGVDSNALANQKSKDPIVSVVNVVNRANVYLVAKKGAGPTGTSPEQLKAFLKGKTIAAGRYGGSPNLLTRSLLLELGLDPSKDVKLEEPADASAVVTMVQQGVATIANGAEPQINEGVEAGIWEEPFYKFPDLGDFSYSVISVKKSTIEKDPETVKAFVEAVQKALKKVEEDKALAKAVVKAEFPTMSATSVDISLKRAYDDQLWSKDGIISKKAVENDMNMVVKTGIYKGNFSYEQLVDMKFAQGK